MRSATPYTQLINMKSVTGVAMNLVLNEQVEQENESLSKVDLTAYQAIALIANPFHLATQFITQLEFSSHGFPGGN